MMAVNVLRKRLCKNMGKIAAVVVAVVMITACVPEMPEEGFVEGTPTLVGTTMFDLTELGYEQSEYFISGTAKSYTSAGPMGSDGKWTVEVEDEAYFKTRIVVYRPIDAERFNGTVIIEWFNVSGGVEAAAEWIMTHTELIRSGYAWVGVSAQKGGIDGGGVNVLGLSLPLKKVKPLRYGTLEHPGDKFAYDIFHQAAKAVLQPENFDPLDGLTVKRAIAAGESQSADFMMTYYNAVAPLDQLFDGYLIHSRIHGSAPLSPDPDATDIDFESRSTVHVRDDLNVPVMNVQTETDLFILGSYEDRQPDSENFRLWEIAGTGHADRYFSGIGMIDRGDNPKVAKVKETTYAVPFLIDCGIPINSGPQNFVVKAAIAALDNWLRSGVAPSHADRFEVDEESMSLKRDSLGNVFSGVRTPHVDVPIATLSGEGQTENDFCFIYGTTSLFDDETLGVLYPDHKAYVDEVEASVNAAVDKGFLLRADGDLIVEVAESSRIGKR